MIAWTLARSRLARAVQTGEPPEVIAELRREYRAARLEHQIREAAPELTPGQREQLARPLLAPDGGDRDVAA